VFFTDPFGSALATVVGYITDYLGWMYMLMTSFFLGFAIWLALSRYGKIRLGRPDDRPEFGRFAFLEQNPLFLLTSISMIFLVWIFFVAGADAGTIVLGSMSAGGVLNPKRTIKLTWGAIMGALAAILLLTGGLDALQNGAILAATPFAILMCLMC
jgi:glycine betaine transporter